MGPLSIAGKPGPWWTGPWLPNVKWSKPPAKQVASIVELAGMTRPETAAKGPHPLDPLIRYIMRRTYERHTISVRVRSEGEALGLDDLAASSMVDHLVNTLYHQDLALLLMPILHNSRRSKSLTYRIHEDTGIPGPSLYPYTAQHRRLLDYHH